MAFKDAAEREIKKNIFPTFSQNYRGSSAKQTFIVCHRVVDGVNFNDVGTGMESEYSNSSNKVLTRV